MRNYGYVPMRNPKQKEETIHSQVCQYLKIQYPQVIFNTDLSGVKLTIGQSAKIAKLRSYKGFPDIMIFEPRGDYYGLFIELKSDTARIYKKNGTPATDHIAEQLKMIEMLNQRGYYAIMVVGFEEAKKQIDNYLTGKI